MVAGAAPVVLPPGVSPPETRDERQLLEQARSFESLLLSFLTKELTSASGLMGESSGASGLHAGLVTEQLADALARGGGVGIAGMLYGQLAGRGGTP